MNAVLLFVAAYLLGALPFGLWIGKIWKGVDVREQGSGNLGATNVFRVLGAGPGILTLVLDISKGWLAVFLAKTFFPDALGFHIGAGLAAVLGHTMSVFVRFKGGKGVATSVGVFAALIALPCAIAVGAFVLLLATTRYVSASSIGAAFALAISSFAFHEPPLLNGAAVFIALFIVWTHRANLQRLAAGTEHKLGQPRPSVS